MYLPKGDYHFKWKNIDEVLVDYDVTFRGSVFEDFRYYSTENNQEEQEEIISTYLCIKDVELKEWKVTDNHRDSAYISLNAVAHASNIIRNISSFKVIQPLKIKLPKFEKPDNRKLDVIINYPVNKSDQSIYDLSGLQKKEIQLPENITIEHTHGFYQTSYRQKGDNVIVNERFTLYANEIKLDQYKKFYDFLDSIIQYKKKSAIILK